MPEETPEDTAPAENPIDGIPANPLTTQTILPRKTASSSTPERETWHTGVDVSAHQGEINWEKAAADGIQFAMIRLGYRGYTEGEIGLDPYFLRNIEGRAGRRTGCRRLLLPRRPSRRTRPLRRRSSSSTGSRAMSWTIRSSSTGRTSRPTPAPDGMDMLTLTGCVDAFCAAIEDAGYRAGVYFNQRFGYQGAESPEPAEIHVLAGRIQSRADVHL